MYASYYVIIIFSVILAAAQEYDGNYLTPTFNHRVYHDQYLKEISPPKPTKQGPVLFPNDAPPPPRPPLIVTSRPLTESVARSELNRTDNRQLANAQNRNFNRDYVTPNPLYNSVAQPSISLAQYRPNYIDNGKEYRPYSFTDFGTPRPVVATPTPVVFVDSVTGRPVEYRDYSDGYGDYRLRDGGVLGSYQRSFDKPTPLPPIYRVLSQHADKELSRVQEKNARLREKQVDLYEDVQPHSHRQHSAPHEHNRVDSRENDYDQNSNYAFSYTVRDRKTGDDFSHSQQSKGSATNGEYRVRLPDGRMQIVSYTADENGYKADVRYDDDYQPSNAYEDTTRRNFYKAEQRPRLNSYEYDDKAQGNNIHQEFGLDKERDYEQENNNYRSYKVDESSQEDTTDDEATKDYFNDYDYNEPHHSRHESKFSQLANKDKNIGVIVVTDKKPLVPSYEELKNLLRAKSPANDFIYKDIPVEINVPSTTPSHSVESTTDKVVLIGGSKKYNEHVTPSLSTPTYQPSPSSYLASTIAGLRKNIDFTGSRPTFSSSFIDRINRYLKS